MEQNAQAQAKSIKIPGPEHPISVELLSRRRQLPAQLLAGIAISDRADTAIDGRFNRENPEALEQMRQADRDAEGAVELRS